MIRGFTVGLVLAVASNAFAAEIADVRTLDDLLALAPIEAAGGYKVRVGISDAGPAAGPVMVLTVGLNEVAAPRHDLRRARATTVLRRN